MTLPPLSLLRRAALWAQPISIANLAQRSSRVRPFSTQTNELLVPKTMVTELPSGLRVATQNTGQATCTLGVWVDAGSRFESDTTNGVAHFLEHMIFKGTARRSKRGLEMEVEDMGGHLNAFTSREMTAYYAQVVNKDTVAAMELLADILQNSAFPLDALESERNVIVRELQEVEKQKDEVVYDLLHMAAFEGNALARPILGPLENIQSITRDMIQDYITTNYTAPRMVVAAAGGVHHDQIVSLSERCLAQFSTRHHVTPVATPLFHSNVIRDVTDDDTAHIGLAFQGVSWSHPYFFPLMVASTLLGAWNRSFGGSESLSSPLARAVGSRDLGKSYLGFNTCYKDTGLWGVYMAANESSIEPFLVEVEREMARLALAVTPKEVERAKMQLKTTTIMSLDGSSPICEDIGRQMLTLNRVMPLAETSARIDAVTAETVQTVLRELVLDKCPAIVGVGPVTSLPSPEHLRAGAHWLDYAV